MGRAHGAVKRAIAGRKLERVAIDHPHAHSLIDKQIALIDVADNDVRRVKRLKCSSRVSRCQHHVMPAGFRKMPTSVRCSVQLVQLAPPSILVIRMPHGFRETGSKSSARGHAAITSRALDQHETMAVSLAT